jgi:hypothetical protein
VMSTGSVERAQTEAHLAKFYELVTILRNSNGFHTLQQYPKLRLFDN